MDNIIEMFSIGRVKEFNIDFTLEKYVIYCIICFKTA